MNTNKREGDLILKVEDLHVSYGKILALHGISFEVNRGDIVAILGANGAGKTTTLNALTGVVPIKSGVITFKGNKINGLSTSKITSMGMVHVPEGRHIFPDLTVGENLRIAAYLYESKNKDLYHERRENVLELFPSLKERENQLGGTLSGGEQQMLAIGRALITGGEILLLDEPSMGLAPMLVREILDTVKRISEEGQTIMLVEQNAMLAMDIASYSYVLETGNIVDEGTTEYIRSQDKIVKAYLG
ncbi:MAG: ABC transporter ATP-binding protein [Anaerolineales bacterium]|jgi:branched-chain amino acid transport system ATP-binding protein